MPTSLRAFFCRDAGVYTVDLTFTGPAGTDNETKPDLISVSPAPHTADFTAGPTTGGAPFAVHFADASTGDIATYHCVTTVNDPAPITTRLRDIDVAGFEAQLQREEASKGSPPIPRRP